MGMNWRYVHKEKVGKQNPIKKALWAVMMFKETPRVIFFLAKLQSLLLSHSLGQRVIHDLTKYYDVAVVWCLGYASIHDHRKREKIQEILSDL